MVNNLILFSRGKLQGENLDLKHEKGIRGFYKLNEIYSNDKNTYESIHKLLRPFWTSVEIYIFRNLPKKFCNHWALEIYKILGLLLFFYLALPRQNLARTRECATDHLNTHGLIGFRERLECKNVTPEVVIFDSTMCLLRFRSENNYILQVSVFQTITMHCLKGTKITNTVFCVTS